MAIAVANSWGNTAAAATVSVTVSGVQVGELLIAIAFGFGNSTLTWNTPAFTDNGTGSVWTNRADSGYITRSRVQVGETVVGSAAPTTVTATGDAGTGGCAMSVLRVTGAASSATHDASVGGGQVSAAPAAPALTTTNANDLIVVGLTHDGALTTLTAPTGFSQSADAVGNSTSSVVTIVPYATGWKVVSAAQSAQTYAWALGASRNAVMIAGGWKAAAAGGAGLPQSFAPVPFMSNGRL